MKSVLLISHGSQSSKTKEEVKALVDILKKRTQIQIFNYAFLEIESPNIPQGIDRCVEAGATEVTILLNFLNSGKHVDVDIPRIVNEARQKYPKLIITITPPVGQHPRIVDVFLNMIHET